MNGVMYTAHEDGSISLFDGNMTFPDDGPGNPLWGFRISHEYPYEGKNKKKVMMSKILAHNSTAVTVFSACSVPPASDVRSVTGVLVLKLAMLVQSLSLIPMMSLNLLLCVTFLTFLPPLLFLYWPLVDPTSLEHSRYQ